MRQNKINYDVYIILSLKRRASDRRLRTQNKQNDRQVTDKTDTNAKEEGKVDETPTREVREV